MDTDGEMREMSDCAEGAENHPVIHVIKKHMASGKTVL